jgi:hypothetical protein
MKVCGIVAVDDVPVTLTHQRLKGESIYLSIVPDL